MLGEMAAAVSAVCTAVLAAVGGGTLWSRRARCRAEGQCLLLRKSLDDAQQHCIDILKKVMRFVEARDRFWRGHSHNVGRLTEQIAQRMGLPAARCRELKVAGELHDIGLVAVPEAMIKNYNKFGLSEFRSVMKHSDVSYEILKPLASLKNALLAVRHHHERMNGTGYPCGLEGGDIPLGARILAVADAYDAMTHDRPHRDAMTPQQAMGELRRCTPAGYDPTCVETLAEIVNADAMGRVIDMDEEETSPQEAAETA
jgi:HD-GYP domain-containing protein (c-di-GMP phosphodiesterase class II)